MDDIPIHPGSAAAPILGSIFATSVMLALIAVLMPSVSMVM